MHIHGHFSYIFLENVPLTYIGKKTKGLEGMSGFIIFQMKKGTSTFGSLKSLHMAKNLLPLNKTSLKFQATIKFL